MNDLEALVTRHLGRPVLMMPDAAHQLALRVLAAEPRAFQSGGLFNRFLSFAGIARPRAFDEDAAEREPLPRGGFAYCPLWMEESGGPDGDLGLGMSLKDGIACLNIDTAISARGREICGAWFHGYDTIAAALRNAFADERVKGIFIRYETPGGVVDDGIEEVCEILRENREAAGGKPVWGFCDVAASAGYWIASQCDRLIASRNSIVGSIGAVMVHWEYSEALKKDGVKVTPIQFGSQKTAGAGYQPLDDVALGDYQAWVDQAGRDFVAAIGLGRPSLTEDQCLATEARIYTGHHDEAERSALGIGLIDELMREPAAFEALRAHTEQAAQSSGDTAAPAGQPPASSATAMTGDPSMAKKTKAAAKRAARIKALEAQIAAIRAEDEAEAIGEDDEAGAEGEEEEVETEGEEEELGAEGEEEEAGAEGEEEEMEAEGEEEEKPAAKTSHRRLAIMGLPEAEGQRAFAKSLADQGLSVKQAQAALRAAKRTKALGSNTDAPLATRPAGTGGKANASQALVADFVAAVGPSRLRKKPGQ